MNIKMEKTQTIKITEGCPNACEYCYEPKEIKDLGFLQSDQYNHFKIIDMNFLANPNALKYLRELTPAKNRIYELICGLDYRLLTPEIAGLLYEKGFIKIRWAWDYTFNDQKKQRKTFLMLKKAGFQPLKMSVFILANWKTSFKDCVKKLDLLKVWGVVVNDCCFDGGYKNTKSIYWTYEQIKTFRRLCRTHNLMLKFGIDPEYKYSDLKKKSEKSLNDYYEA